MRLFGIAVTALFVFGCSSGAGPLASARSGSAPTGADAVRPIGVGAAANDGLGPIIGTDGSGRHKAPISLIAAPSTATVPGLTPLHAIAGDFADTGRAQLLTTFREPTGTVSLTLASFDAAARVDQTDLSIIPSEDVGPLASFSAGFGIAGVAIVQADGERVDVQRNLGGGFFDAGSLFLGGKLVAIATGDLDGDGRDDLVVSDASGSIAVALQVGFGGIPSGFQYVRRLPMGAPPDAVVVADLDGDGARDLAVVVAPNIAVLLGNGDGTFGAAHTYAVGGMAGPLAVTDVDGDGAPDLVTAPAGDGALVILPGVGDGTFGDARRVPIERSVSALLVAGDLDGDGTGDLIARSELGATVILGSACGKPGVFLDYDAGPLLAVGDLTGDGQLDIGAVASPLTPDGTGFISALRGLGGAQFFAARRFPQSGTALARGDFNADGREDLAAGSLVDGATIDAWLATHAPALLRHGSKVPLGLGFTRIAMASADFDGDGNLDLAVTLGGDGGAVHFLLGDGAGGFRVGASVVVVPQPANDENPGAVAVGHFHPGGAPDLAVSTNGGFVRVLLNRGDGTFDGPFITELAGTVGLAVADFNRDGRDDLAVATSNVVRVALGHGDGTFGTPIESAGPQVPVRIGAGDFDGDGRQDIAITALTPRDGFAVPPLVVLDGAGDGSFPTTLDAPPGDFVAGFPALAIADYNRDGIDDIALALDGRIDVYQGARGGVMPLVASYRFATRQNAAIAVDLAGCALPSLAVLGGDSLLVLRNATR